MKLSHPWFFCFINGNQSPFTSKTVGQAEILLVLFVFNIKKKKFLNNCLCPNLEEWHCRQILLLCTILRIHIWKTTSFNNLCEGKRRILLLPSLDVANWGAEPLYGCFRRNRSHDRSPLMKRRSYGLFNQVWKRKSVQWRQRNLLKCVLHV